MLTVYNGGKNITTEEVVKKNVVLNQIWAKWRNNYASIKLGSNVGIVVAFADKNYGGNTAVISSDMASLTNINGVDLKNDIRSFAIGLDNTANCVKFWNNGKLESSWELCGTSLSIPSGE